jgi:cation-transporting ATPase E
VREQTADPNRGLSRAEVEERIARGLDNDVPAVPTRTLPEIVRANVLTRFNAILGSMLAVILIVGQLQDALFGVVLVANSVIGIVQELRAKRTLERLTLLAGVRPRVVREGRVEEVELGALVLGDILDLRAGDHVPVDARVIVTTGLEIDESLITGESEPIAKRPGDEVLSGSIVVTGSGERRARRTRRLCGADRRGRQALHPYPFGSPGGDRPPARRRDLPARANRHAAVRQPAAGAGGMAGRDLGLGRRDRRDGP